MNKDFMEFVQKTRYKLDLLTWHWYGDNAVLAEYGSKVHNQLWNRFLKTK